MPMPRVANLTIDNKTLELPVIVGSEGEAGIDIAKLRAETGAVTFDPAYGNTGACKSAITFIDGDKGILRYRGIPIEQLAEKSSFGEVVYLLIFGQLPTRAQLDRFLGRVAASAQLYPGYENHLKVYPRDAQPMAILSAMINNISCFNYDLANPDSQEQFEEVAARLVSKMTTIGAAVHRSRNGLPFVTPDTRRGYVSNFLHMMF